MAHRLDALQTQRQAAVLSAKQLAEKANLSEFWINRGEQTAKASTPSGKGNPFPVAESLRIAGVLGVSLATLGKVDV